MHAHTLQPGQFELLDKSLKLLSADIRFEGTIPPSPYLDIKAESGNAHPEGNNQK